MLGEGVQVAQSNVSFPSTVNSSFLCQSCVSAFWQSINRSTERKNSERWQWEEQRGLICSSNFQLFPHNLNLEIQSQHYSGQCFSLEVLSHKQAKCVRQQEFDHIWKSHKNLLLCRLPLFALPFSINTCQKDKFQEIFSMWFPSDSLFSGHLHEIIGVRTNTREGSQTL